MTYGIQCFSKTGQVTYDSSMSTWNQVANKTVAQNEVYSQSAPALLSREVAALRYFVNAPPADREAHMPAVSVNNVAASFSIGQSGVAAEAAVVLVLMR